MAAANTNTVEKIKIEPQANHVDTWLHIKGVLKERRGFDLGQRWRKPIPRTTNGDVKQLADYWHRAVRDSTLRSFFVSDADASSRKRWMRAKEKIDAQLRGADLSALYPENEWFWEEASYGAASYLSALAFVPTHFEMLGEATIETLKDHKKRIEDVAEGVVDKADEIWDVIKTGALILGGLIGAAIVVPPVIRAFRRDERHD